MDRVLSSLILLLFVSYPEFDPRLALVFGFLKRKPFLKFYISDIIEVGSVEDLRN